MEELDPRKELFDLNYFNSAKVMQVVAEILDVDHPNLTCML